MNGSSTLENLIFTLYCLGLSISFVQIFHFIFKRDWQKVNNWVIYFLLFVFALLPMLSGGNWVQITGSADGR